MTTSYVELRAHTAFSFGDGAVSPERLVRRAAELGYGSIGITDTADLGAVVRAYREAEQCGIQLIVGAELRVDGAPMALLVRTEQGCRHLASLITRSRVGPLQQWTKTSVGRQRGMPHATWADVRARSQGLQLLTGPASGHIARLVRDGQTGDAERLIHEWREAFEGHVALEVQDHRTGGTESALAGALIALAKRADVPWVVTHDPRYIDHESRLVHDMLTALRCGTDLDGATARGFLHPNGEWCLRSPHEMAAVWAGCEAGLATSAHIASECAFDLRWLRPPLPNFPNDGALDLQSFLCKQVYAGAKKRWGSLAPRQFSQLEHELDIIERLGFAGFFLVMWDAVRHARDDLNVLCQGRGSAANSAVAYCLGVTAVDPIANNLLFERFLSDVRVSEHRAVTEAPDIDVDIEHDKREGVLDYVYQKYGRSHAAITCIVQTYGASNAVRDAMRALGYPAELATKLSKRLHRYDPADGSVVIKERLAKQFGVDCEHPRGRALLAAMQAFDGLPRLRSTHVGGFVLSAGPVGEYLPVEHTTMGRTIIQFDKDDLDAIGVPKFDFLGLGALSLVRHAFDAIKHRTGRSLELYNLPQRDTQTFEMIARGDTLGMFQIESRAQIASILHTRPELLYDIVVQIALVRPGPIQGEFVRPYTRRRRGQEVVRYLHPLLEPILERTQGIPIFQEQAMKISSILGGFTAAESDQLRRTMGNIKKKARLAAVLERLKARMIANEAVTPRVTPDVAEQIGKDLLTFANYGFPESHAWSFAYIAYATAYLKCHYPAEFYLGILNAQPMGFYPMSTLIHDARRHGVDVRPPCLFAGDQLCTIEPAAIEPTANIARPALRIGLRHIRGVGAQTLERVTSVREAAPFRSIADTVQRVGMNKTEALQFARAGAFSAWEADRRRAGWEALRAVGDTLSFAPAYRLGYAPRPLEQHEIVFLDYHATGICTTGHPMEHVRERLHGSGVLDSHELEQCRSGDHVIVAGLVTVRQRPGSANGVIFLLLEDEVGFVNVIVAKELAVQYAEVVKFAPFVVVQGRVERDGAVLHVIGKRFRELPVRGDLTHWVHSFH